MFLSALSSLSTRILHRCDAETAHQLAIGALAAGLVPSAPSDPKELNVDILGLTFPNPIGLGAGFDKDARAMRALIRSGFGFIECGTVTPQPQTGNPKPRVFRLKEDRAIINRMGFNSCGLSVFEHRMSRFRKTIGGRKSQAPIGINVGVNRTCSTPLRDYPIALRRMAPLADYITVNISSPNTPGLRDLQTVGFIADLMRELRAQGPQLPPLFIKLAPDLPDDSLIEIAHTAMDNGVDGLILTNTTLARPHGLHSENRNERGGLSGRPLAQGAIHALRTVWPVTRGRIRLISCGGIETGFDVIERLRLGADLVQIYTSFIYEGPLALRRIKREMQGEMRRRGYATLNDVYKDRVS